MKTAFSRLTFTAALTALLVGCGSNVKLDEPPVESRTPTAVTPGGASGTAGGSGAGASSAGVTAGGPASQSQVATVNVAPRANAGGAGALPAGTPRVVYFDFDSFVVRDDARPVVDAHAKMLAANKARKMVIEGHTDERGGREYNLALGQKRAEAVAKALVLLGAADSQLEAVSFGKERPAAQGNDEAAWAKNRRAELKDRP
jgi:peptidoglycan-associated lipoprotein